MREARTFALMRARRPGDGVARQRPDGDCGRSRARRDDRRLTRQRARSRADRAVDDRDSSSIRAAPRPPPRSCWPPSSSRYAEGDASQSPSEMLCALDGAAVGLPGARPGPTACRIRSSGGCGQGGCERPADDGPLHLQLRTEHNRCLSRDNLKPFALGAAATGVSTAFDDSVKEYFAPTRRAKWLGDAVDVEGQPYVIVPLATALYVTGRLSPSHTRYQAATYDIAQATIVEAVYSTALKYTPTGCARTDRTTSPFRPAIHRTPSRGPR